MKTTKILKKLIERLEDLKDRPSDAYMNGRNCGLDEAIYILKDKIIDIKNI